MTLAVEVRNLYKRYERRNVEALAGVSFCVEEGEIFGYLGRNGAGKSTTVRILTTLLRPTSGTALVGGFDVRSDPAATRRVLGAVLQDAALDKDMTGREHLILAGRLSGLGKVGSQQRANELLEIFGLTAAANRTAARYSGGMRRRLDVAMAMVRRPALLFLDEPTNGLDPQARRAFWGVVRELRDQGSTVFLTTQNLEEADDLADRIAIVHQGRIAAIGRPDELKAQFGGAMTIRMRADPATAIRVRAAMDDGICSSVGDSWLQVRLDGGSGVLLTTISYLVEVGVAMEQLSVCVPSLEDAFVKLTGVEIESLRDAGEVDARAASRQEPDTEPVSSG